MSREEIKSSRKKGANVSAVQVFTKLKITMEI
jgi:hypothetical protein